MVLYELSATAIIEKIKAREATCVEVATAFIQRIKEINPSINAIHQFDPKRILAEARKKDRHIEEGKQLGRLHGIPISLKDAFYAPGFKGAKGCVHLFSTSPTNKIAVAVKRILDEGAIILGITNVPEFCAAFETSNLLNGTTNNPYDLTRVSGGSSGGEAALIAAGGSCLGLGSDAGGSIRVPAHYCGIAGLKPTKGRVPTTGNAPNDAGGLHTPLLTFGPMARTVEDLELLLTVIAGADNGDPLSIPMPLKESTSVDISKLRATYFLDNGLITPDEDTLKNVSSAIERFKPYVASINLVSLPNIFKETYRLVWDTCFLGGDQGKLFFDSLINVKPKFSPLFERHLKNIRASFFDNTELRLRIMQMHEYKQAFLQLMNNTDVLLCPVTATPARLHVTTHDHLNDYTYAMMSNLTGAPAATINCGFSKNGLPIGIQIIAKPWDDHIVLAIAKKGQEVLGVPGVVHIEKIN